jgi:peptidoglycan/LPS O-acetylase OafA/YrhL
MSPHLIRIDALRGVAILMVMQLHIFFITLSHLQNSRSRTSRWRF